MITSNQIVCSEIIRWKGLRENLREDFKLFLAQIFVVPGFFLHNCRCYPFWDVYAYNHQT